MVAKAMGETTAEGGREAGKRKSLRLDQ